MSDTKQKITTVLGTEIQILNWKDHNTEETKYIGDIDLPGANGSNDYTPLLSFFKHEPLMYEVGGSNKSEKYIITQKPAPAEHKIKQFQAVPYVDYIYEPKENKKIRVDREHLNVTIPNKFNPHLGANYGKNLYPGTSSATVGRRHGTEELLAPPITESEYKSLRNVSASNMIKGDPSITNCWVTKDFYRHDPDYAIGYLQEYIMMSFGDLKYKNDKGEIMTIEAKDNLGLVPVVYDYNYVNIFAATEEERKEQLRQTLYIPSEFIKAKNEAIKANLIQSQVYSIESIENSAGNSTLSDPEMQEFLEWKKSKENTENTTEKTQTAPNKRGRKKILKPS